MKNFIDKIPKNYKLAISAVVVILVAALLVSKSQNKGSMEELPTLETPQEEQVITGVYRKPKQPDVVDIQTPPVDTRNYSELILAFQGKTLQFGKNCQVRMSSQVYKMGSQILLDNRNEMPVSIKIGSNVYNLSSYGYSVVTLNTEGEFMVDCGEYENVATVTVQH